MFIDNTKRTGTLSISSNNDGKTAVKDILYRGGKPSNSPINSITIYQKNKINSGNMVTRKYERTYIEPNDIDISITTKVNLGFIPELEEIRLKEDVIRYINGYMLSINPINIDRLNEVIGGNTLGTITIRNIKTGVEYGTITFNNESIPNNIATDVNSISISGTQDGLTHNSNTERPVTQINNAIIAVGGTKIANVKWNGIDGTYKDIKSKIDIDSVDGNVSTISSISSTTATIANNVSNTMSTAIIHSNAEKNIEIFAYGKLYLTDTSILNNNSVSDVIPITLHHYNIVSLHSINTINIYNNTILGGFSSNSVLPNAIDGNNGDVVMVDTNMYLTTSDIQTTIYPDKDTSYNTLQIWNNSSIPSGYQPETNYTIPTIDKIYSNTIYTNGSSTAVFAIPNYDTLISFANIYPYTDSYGCFKVLVLSNTGSSYYKGSFSINTYSTLTKFSDDTDLIKEINFNYYVSNNITNNVDDILYIHIDTSKKLYMNIGDTVRIPVVHSANTYTTVNTSSDGGEIEIVKDLNPIQGYKKYRVDGNDSTIYRHQDTIDGDMLITGISNGNIVVRVQTNPKSFASVYKTFNIEVLPNPTIANIEIETSYIILNSNSSKRVAFYIDKCKDVEVELICPNEYKVDGKTYEYKIGHRLYKYYNHETQEMSGYIVIQPLQYKDDNNPDRYIPFQVKIKAMCDEEVIGTKTFTGRVYPQDVHKIEIMDINNEYYMDTIINNLDTWDGSTYDVNLYTTAKYVVAHDYDTTITKYQLEEIGGIAGSGTYDDNIISTTDIDNEINNLSNTALKLLYPNGILGYRNDYKLYGTYRDHISKLYSNAVLFDLAKLEAKEHIFRYDAKYLKIYPNRNIGNGKIKIAAYDSYTTEWNTNNSISYNNNGITDMNLYFNNIANTTIPNNEIWVTLQHNDITKTLDYSGTDTNYTILKWKNRNSIDDVYNCKIYLPSVSGKLLSSLNDLTKQTSKKYFTKSSTTRPSANSNLTKGDSWLDTSTGRVWVCKDDTTNYNYWYAYPEQIVGNVTLHSYPKVGIGNIPLDILDTLPIIPLDGCYDVNSSNYGNYKDKNNNILVYIPAVYVDNSNNLSGYKKENYTKHSFFNNSIGILVPKYPIPENASGIEYSKENRVKATTIRDDLLDEIKIVSGLNVEVINNGDDLRNLLAIIKGNTDIPSNDFNNLITTNNLHTTSGVVYDNGIRYHIYVSGL